MGSMVGSQSPFRYPGMFRCTTGAEEEDICVTERTWYCHVKWLKLPGLVRGPGLGLGVRGHQCFLAPLRGPPTLSTPKRRILWSRTQAPGSSALTLLCVCWDCEKFCNTDSKLADGVVGTEQFLSLFLRFWTCKCSQVHTAPETRIPEPPCPGWTPSRGLVLLMLQPLLGSG